MLHAHSKKVLVEGESNWKFCFSCSNPLCIRVCSWCSNVSAFNDLQIPGDVEIAKKACSVNQKKIGAKENIVGKALALKMAKNLDHYQQILSPKSYQERQMSSESRV